MELYLSDEELGKELKKLFPDLKDDNFIDELIKHGTYQELDEGSVLLNHGDYIKRVPLVLDGYIRVSRQDEDGSELLLYYVGRGETCAMSLTCCMAQERSRIKADVGEPASLLFIPVDLLDKWMMEYKDWKNFIMHSYANRFEELLAVIDSIAFKRMDERITDYLKEKASQWPGNAIEVTHQKIADDLHSSREVISRILKKMEQKGLIQMARNKITLLND